jgi:hypothetical protein
MGLGDINIGEASAVAAANTAGEATVLPLSVLPYCCCWSFKSADPWAAASPAAIVRDTGKGVETRLN